MGFLKAVTSEPPHLLIEGQGKLVAAFDQGILHISSIRKGKFTAEIWQKYLAAKQTKPMACEDGVCQSFLQGLPLVITYTQEKQPCLKGAVLIRLEPSQMNCPDARLILDWYDLWRRGGHAVWLTPQGFQIENVRDSQGSRPWTRQAIHRKERPMNREYKNT